MSDVKWDAIQPLGVSQEAIEQCILLLQKAGWMQEHDRLLTEGKTGKWINHKDEHRCSCCGEAVTGDWFYDDDAYSYCPNCGARMVE